MSRHPERSASARKRRCAKSKDACAPFESGSARRFRSGGLLRLRAAGTPGGNSFGPPLSAQDASANKSDLVSEQQRAQRTAARPAVPGARSISALAGRARPAVFGCAGSDSGRSARACLRYVAWLLRNQVAPLGAGANTLKVGPFTLLPVASVCGPTFRVFAHSSRPFAPGHGADTFLAALSPEAVRNSG